MFTPFITISDEFIRAICQQTVTETIQCPSYHQALAEGLPPRMKTNLGSVFRTHMSATRWGNMFSHEEAGSLHPLTRISSPQRVFESAVIA